MNSPIIQTQHLETCLVALRKEFSCKLTYVTGGINTMMGARRIFPHSRNITSGVQIIHLRDIYYYLVDGMSLSGATISPRRQVLGKALRSTSQNTYAPRAVIFVTISPFMYLRKFELRFLLSLRLSICSGARLSQNTVEFCRGRCY